MNAMPWHQEQFNWPCSINWFLCFLWGLVSTTCAISVSRIVKKCICIDMFPQISSAWQGLILIVLSCRGEPKGWISILFAAISPGACRVIGLVSYFGGRRSHINSGIGGITAVSMYAFGIKLEWNRPETGLAAWKATLDSVILKRAC